MADFCKWKTYDNEAYWEINIFFRVIGAGVEAAKVMKSLSEFASQMLSQIYCSIVLKNKIKSVFLSSFFCIIISWFLADDDRIVKS